MQSPCEVWGSAPTALPGKSSAQLAVFAPFSVVERKTGLFFVFLFLAAEAQAYTRQGFAPCFGDGFPAGFTFRETFPMRQAAARSCYLIFQRAGNLIIDGVICGPSSGHCTPSVGKKFVASCFAQSPYSAIGSIRKNFAAITDGGSFHSHARPGAEFRIQGFEQSKGCWRDGFPLSGKIAYRDAR